MQEELSLEKIKKDLRISHSKLDEDIRDNIEACKLDLKRVGIDVNKSDVLLEKSIKLFLRWQYNFENQADRYRNAYESLRNALSLCEDYRNSKNV
ncbi:putative phage DNA packaging protein [Anaerococcus hydrogenalis DSM 7454]|uniref:Putative phage DNA packaging protein n=1 Tax=Anaerococcus hydrogenalis DSM 7454 TaxID=561177 RepID=B6W9Y5_9FIRM|nr:hypothetical protein [Anaerococcus hydrogenalis]EEB35745.1 putative phage DNA packaging protein [Anaerococcus hydrogenalis DSM 7454]